MSQKEKWFMNSLEPEESAVVRAPGGKAQVCAGVTPASPLASSQC